jgi:hypothetical protein
MIMKGARASGPLMLFVFAGSAPLCGAHGLLDRRLPAGIMIMSRLEAGGPKSMKDAPLEWRAPSNEWSNASFGMAGRLAQP